MKTILKDLTDRAFFPHGLQGHFAKFPEEAPHRDEPKMRDNKFPCCRQCTPSACRSYPIGLLHNRAVRKRSALPITETELRLMAAAAMIGDSSKPNIG